MGLLTKAAGGAGAHPQPNQLKAVVSRRTLLRAIVVATVGAVSPAARGYGQSSVIPQVWIPLAQGGATNDAPILGASSGTTDQATAWFGGNSTGYTVDDCAVIVNAYQQQGEPVGLDWFLALAQMGIETGSLTSWWSQRPQRNPAGIGVTGQAQAGTPDVPPGPGWTWDGTQWQEGWSFASWVNDSVPAHLGRLLAYALTDAQATPAQQQLINLALAYRPLPLSYRGIAPTIDGLNGIWAVPGTTYGQDILRLAMHMRGG